MNALMWTECDNACGTILFWRGILNHVFMLTSFKSLIYLHCFELTPTPDVSAPRRFAATCLSLPDGVLKKKMQCCAEEQVILNSAPCFALVKCMFVSDVWIVNKGSNGCYKS